MTDKQTVTLGSFGDDMAVVSVEDLRALTGGRSNGKLMGFWFETEGLEATLARKIVKEFAEAAKQAGGKLARTDVTKELQGLFPSRELRTVFGKLFAATEGYQALHPCGAGYRTIINEFRVEGLTP